MGAVEVHCDTSPRTFSDRDMDGLDTGEDKGYAKEEKKQDGEKRFEQGVEDKFFHGGGSQMFSGEKRVL